MEHHANWEAVPAAKQAVALLLILAALIHVFFLGRFQSNDVQPLSSLVHRCLVTHPKKLRTEGLSRPLIFKVFGTNSQFLLVLDNTLGAAYSVAELCPCNKFQISIIKHNKYHT